MRNWIHTIPDSDNPTKQGHIVFLRNNGEIAEIFERSLDELLLKAGVMSSSLRESRRKYKEELEQRRITADEYLYKLWKHTLHHGHHTKWRGDDPVRQGYRRLLDDMFSLRPELLTFFFEHFLDQYGDSTSKSFAIALALILGPMKVAGNYE